MCQELASGELEIIIMITIIIKNVFPSLHFQTGKHLGWYYDCDSGLDLWRSGSERHFWCERCWSKRWRGGAHRASCPPGSAYRPLSLAASRHIPAVPSLILHMLRLFNFPLIHNIIWLIRMLSRLLCFLSSRSVCIPLSLYLNSMTFLDQKLFHASVTDLLRQIIYPA